MLILWEYFKTKMKKIGQLERMLHWVKIDKFKKISLYKDGHSQYCRNKILLILYQYLQQKFQWLNRKFSGSVLGIT